jgi:hypothetical protein
MPDSKSPLQGQKNLNSMKIQHSLLIPKPGQCGEPLDLADRKIYKQKKKRQQALRKDEKKILYYKLNSVEIQHSS